MDVDLLRPGTVPISPDTILWFEFLLNPSLLEKHLSKPFPDPSATDLIIKFITINSDPRDEVKIIDDNETKPEVNKLSHKSLAIKILGLKVAAYLKWDLDILEKKLPLPIQINLLQDLFYITGDSFVEFSNIPEYNLETISEQLLFTVVLYHRWHIRAIVHRALNNKQNKPQFLHIPGLQEGSYISPVMIEEIVRKLELNATNSINVLNAALKLENISPKVVSFNTLRILTENSTDVEQNWDNLTSISIEEFRCQIHYDLATFYILREEYSTAKQHLSEARDYFEKLKATEMVCCKIQKETLEGLCLACGLPVEDKKPSLMQQLLVSIKDQYNNIVQILQEDNISKEIPLVYRDNLELDIQGGLVNRKIIVSGDLLLQIQCLNLVRKVLGNHVVLGDYASEISAAGTKGLETLFWAINNVLDKVDEGDRRRLSRYLLYLVLSENIENLASWIMNDPKLVELLSPEEVAEIEKEARPEDLEIPSLLTNNDWGVSCVTYTKSQTIAIFDLEQRLTLSYDPVEIKEIIQSLDTLNPGRSMSRINNNWELSIPFQSVLISFPRGVSHDYYWVLLAKSRELAKSRDFVSAKNFLKVLEEEIQSNSQSRHNKLSKLVSWEILLIEIWHCLYSWPARDVCRMFNTQDMVDRCKQCLAALNSTDQVIPRQEIIEYCTVFLLNMCEWEYLMNADKRWTYLEFAAAISNVCQDIKYKGFRKFFPRESWDLVLTAFGSNRDTSQKRNSTGGAANSSRDPLPSIVGTLNRLREPTALTAAISLFARLHNVLRDEANQELYMQHLSFWPLTVPNSNSYNIRMISDFLFQLLTQALKYHPDNVQWLRLMADLNFVLGYYESAMKYYLVAIMLASDLFSEPIPKPQIDDMVWRRMIKCCAHLQCYTQAAVLCQFLDEIDYSLAFKMVSTEQKGYASADAMDAYYYCIWDTTLLEYLINIHTKRGEHHRKQLAIKIIGLLELNSNNNEEIQREAANTRKAKFLRALAKQYVY